MLFGNMFYSYNHSNIPCMTIEPIKTDMDNSIDFIGSPIQSQEQITTQKKVNSRISNDFLEKMCLIIILKFDIFVS